MSILWEGVEGGLSEFLLVALEFVRVFGFGPKASQAQMENVV